MLSSANIEKRRVAEHLLAVKAKWQALRTAFLAKARLVLVVGGLLRRLARGPLRQNGGTFWYALRRSKEANSENETALRAWHRGLQARIESVFSSLSGQFQVEETRARSVWGVMTRVVSKATVLHG